MGTALPSSSRSFWLAVLLLVLAAPASSQVVELNPVPVSGTIRIGDLVVNALTVRLSSSVGSSVATIPIPPDTVAASYSTIVQVPAGGGAFYRLNVDVNLRTADASQFFGFRADVPGSVFVRDGEPATLDLILDPPSLVRGTVTAVPGELLESVSLRAEHWDTSLFGIYLTSVTAPPGGATSLTLEMPVLAGIQLRCGGSANMTNGRGAALEPFQLVTVADGGVETCDFTPAEPPPTGGIAGEIDYFGDVPVDQYRIFANRRGGGAEPPDILLLPPFVPGPGNRAAWEFSDVEAFASYDISALLELEGGQQNVAFGVNEDVGVGPGQTTLSGGGSICQATIVSGFEFGGLTAPEEWDFGPEPVDPVSVGRLSELSASSRPLADPRDGPVRMLATEGTWSQGLSFSIHRDRFAPGGFTATRTTGSGFRFSQPFPVECGETATTPDRVLETGRVEVQFRVAGGGFLQSPLIRAFCSHEDPGSGEEIYRYEVLANSATSTSVQLGVVPVEAPAAVCDFTATARVGGVVVSFGALNDVEIIPGAEVVIGLGGPRVQIISPGPGAVVDASEILVTGTASDDGEVVSVLVNGVEAALTPSGNPDDPREVVFTATVPLEPGDNRIAALATDDEGNETEADLTIENLMPPPGNDPPSLVITSPEPGTATGEDALNIRGIASDDVEVASVLVNGLPAVLTPTGNPDDPNEVGFVIGVFLAFPGVHTITAVATDDRGEQTEVTIEIEKVQPSRLCDVDGDLSVDINDIDLIFAARGSPASGPDDPRDANGDGLITINDGRLCVLECDLPRCADVD